MGTKAESKCCPKALISVPSNRLNWHELASGFIDLKSKVFQDLGLRVRGGMEIQPRKEREERQRD